MKFKPIKNSLWNAMKVGAARAKARAKATGQDPDDMLIPLCADGNPVEPQSIQEFNATGKPMPFLCIPCSLETYKIVPGSTRQKCDGCGNDVWMSPGTKIAFDKIERKVIVCVECFQPQDPKP
jgi:hypothetical protein